MTEVVKQPPTQRELIKSEYLKCAADPIYFMKKYVYIQTTNKGRMLFSLFLFQEKVIHNFNKFDSLLVLKSRQLGITTVCAAYALWNMVFKKDFKVLALAPDKDTAKAIIDKITFAYDNLPSWFGSVFKLKHDEKNKHSIKLNNGSGAQAIAGRANASRSKTCNLLILDEAAFIEKAQELFAAAQQTQATGGKKIVLSTPNGANGWFYEKCEEALQGKSEYVMMEIPWHFHPERDQAWRDAQDKELGVKLASQECDAKFLETGDTYFDSEDLSFMEKGLQDPIDKIYKDKAYWIWEYPVPNKSYIILADTARGDGSDFSAFQIIDIYSWEQVASFEGTLSTKEYAKFLVAEAIRYNNALLVPENTGIGWSVVSDIIELGYENLFYSYKDNTADVSKFLQKRYDVNTQDFIPGFTNSQTTRPLVMNKLSYSSINRSMKIRCRRTWAQFKSCVWINGKPQAKRGTNDDLLISYGIGIYLRETALAYQDLSRERTRQMLGNIKGPQNQLPVQSTIKGFVNPYQQNLNGQVEDIRWVLDGF